MPHSTAHGKTSPTIARLMQSSTVINGRWCHIRWCDRNAVEHRRYDVSIVIYLWYINVGMKIKETGSSAAKFSNLYARSVKYDGQDSYA